MEDKLIKFARNIESKKIARNIYKSPIHFISMFYCLLFFFPFALSPIFSSKFFILNIIDIEPISSSSFLVLYELNLYFIDWKILIWIKIYFQQKMISCLFNFEVMFILPKKNGAKYKKKKSEKKENF